MEATLNSAKRAEPQRVTLGRSAVLHLGLIEARRELEAVRASRREYNDLDTQARALADEMRCEGKHQQAHSYSAASVRYRCRLISLDVELHGLLANVAAIEADLAREQPDVVLSAEQCAAMDDTMNCRAVASYA